MANTIHDTAVKLLSRAYPQMRTNGFSRAFKALDILSGRVESPELYPEFDQFSPQHESEEFVGWDWYRQYGEPPRNMPRPDGWLVDFDHQMIVVFEVEDTHPLDLTKLELYYHLYLEWIDTWGWGLALIAVDRWGARRAVPLFDYVFAGQLDHIQPDSFLGNIQFQWSIEHRYAELAVEAEAGWKREQMATALADARRNETRHLWALPKCRDVFERLMTGRSDRPVKVLPRFDAASAENVQ